MNPLRWFEERVRRRVLPGPQPTGFEAAIAASEVSIEHSRRRQEAQRARLQAIDAASQVMRRRPDPE